MLGPVYRTTQLTELQLGGAAGARGGRWRVLFNAADLQIRADELTVLTRK